MGALETIFGIVLLLFSIAIIIVVLLQEGHQASLGSITGGADTFLSKNKSKLRDATLAKVTAILAAVLAVVTLALNIVINFVK